MAKPVRRAKRWATLALLAVVVMAAVHGVRAQEQRATDDVAVEVPPAHAVPEFVPTEEWQDVLPGQAVPPGLHVRLNLATGKREAKLISEDDVDPALEDPNVIKRDVEVGLEKSGDASVTVATDITGEINAAQSHAVAVVPDAEPEAESADKAESVVEEAVSDEKVENAVSADEAPPAQEPNWNHEKIYEVLQALPEPPQVGGMDIHDAHAKLSEPEFRKQMIKLWKKRQEDLKQAIDSMQDDAKYLAKLLDQFREAEKNGDTDGQVRVLEVLEWEVQDLDKTHVFNFIGGFSVIAEYLNSTNFPVRAHASWVIGSAVKNYKDGQDWAISAGVIPKLVDSLTLRTPAEDLEQHDAVMEVKKKAIYALSSLVRFNKRAQRLLLSLQGPDKLSQLMDESHPRSVRLKTVLFVHDILLEEATLSPSTDEDAALAQLQEAFQSSSWCEHVANFVSEHATKLQRNQIVESMEAMRSQLPSCKTAFNSLNVKGTIETLRSTWTADHTLEEEERNELTSVGDALLSEL